jgi:glycosyltransferase involved in cell wall biosynthesis/2-polyprenyl-3-methyl-5-hydroxy-6-metoxy-1,4-benzoquinol methylase
MAGNDKMGDQPIPVGVGGVVPTCWCGNTELVPFAPAYLKCQQCETLVVERMPGPDIARVTDEQRDLYGREYWFSHQERDLGAPSIIARARADLPERCLHWLYTVLKYKLPPAHVLELGSAHGGFVALLRQAGFAATGLEISPWVVAFARRTFDVPMLQGQVEEQAIEPRSLDLIVLMDVLEHLADPARTIAHCLTLLKDGGLLLVQTPRLPEGTTYQDLVARHDRFLELLQPAEHLYLFSQRSIREFFHRLGADFLEFEPAIFAHYDMFLAVSASPLSHYLPSGVEAALGRTSEGRMVQALLDLSGQFHDLQQQHVASEADRAARLVIIEDKGRQLAQVDGERQHAQGQIVELRRQVETAEAERAKQELRLAEGAAEHRDLQERLSQLQESFHTVTIGHHALEAQLAQLSQLQKSFESVAAERQALQEQLDKQRDHVRNLQGALARLESELNAARLALRFVSQTRGYRVMRRLGRWSVLEQMLAQNMPAEPSGEERATAGHDDRPLGLEATARLTRIAVDLTPIVPGGANGGVKLMAVELIRQLSQIAADCEFILLTAERSHDELAPLESLNVRRHCVEQSSATTDGPRTTGSLRRTLGVDLLFCPFTAPYYFDATIPTVSVIVDLQYLYHPQFFPADEYHERDKNFRDACHLATRVVCISDYVRETVLAKAGLDPDRVTTIHIRLPHRVSPPSREIADRVRGGSGLKDDRFVIYPANFWPHKNHAMLLTAFGMFRSRYPESDLRLVCTGTPDAQMESLREKVRRMELGHRVLFLGYVPDEEFAVLMRSALAVIFPSLYEGFGMPVLEAMACGTPVLCSNVTSLPEVAGDAALFFDPRKPAEIADAIARIIDDPDLVKDLVRRGYERVAAFSDPSEMARQYLRVFREVLVSREHFATQIRGIHGDGWLGERLVITYDAATEDDPSDRHFELILTAPAHHPRDRVTVSLTGSDMASPESHVIERGTDLSIRRALLPTGGFLEIASDTVFQPAAHGMGTDRRLLSCMCRSCRIVTSAGVLDLFGEST